MEEALQFVESRLQQRKVKVCLVGVTPQGQLVATLLHPMGNISRFPSCGWSGSLPGSPLYHARW